MRSLLLTSCVLLGLVASSVVSAGDDKELEKFRGTWRIVAVEAGGEKLPEEIVKKLDIQLIFAGNKYTEKTEGKVGEDGTFKVDTTKTPHHLDLSIESGKDKGKKQLAIYKFDGDKLIVSLSRPGEETRPTELTSKVGTEAAVHTLIREKDAPK